MSVNRVHPSWGGPWRTGPPGDHRPPPAGSAAEDAVNGAFAVLVVAAALGRWAAEAAAEAAVDTRRRVLARLPFSRTGVVRRAVHGPVLRALTHPASAAVRVLAAAADELVPDAARAVLARVDVPGLVRDFVDLDRLAEMLDVDTVVARLDLDALVDKVDVSRVVDRVDLDAIAARLDLDALVDKVDVSRVVDRVDLDAIAARLDLDALVDKVDVSRVVDRVDLDHAVDRVDIDRVIARADVAGLARYVVEEIDLPGLLRDSTGSVTGEVVRGVRHQGVDADHAVERVVDRLLHRSGRRTGTGAADGRGPGGAK